MRVHFRLAGRRGRANMGTAKAVEGKDRVCSSWRRHHPNRPKLHGRGESGDHGPELVIRFEYRPGDPHRLASRTIIAGEAKASNVQKANYRLSPSKRITSGNTDTTVGHVDLQSFTKSTLS